MIFHRFKLLFFIVKNNKLRGFEAINGYRYLSGMLILIKKVKKAPVFNMGF